MLTSEQIMKAARLRSQLGYNPFGDREAPRSRYCNVQSQEQNPIEIRLRLMNDVKTGELRYIRVDEQGNRLE